MTSGRAFAGTTVDFGFEDGRRLLETQREGGRVYVPDDVSSSESTPLVVFLHGTNREGRLHRWMRPGPRDLRPVVDALIAREAIVPVLLAAPSQTRDADSGRSLWSNFDLARFLDRTQGALGDRARVAPEQVIVLGHSGAGCNTAGGLLRIAAERSEITPAAIVAIDTCMSADTARFLAQADERTTRQVYWQPFTWPRDFQDFLDQVAPRRTDVFREIHETGPSPHYDVVRPAFVAALETLLPSGS